MSLRIKTLVLLPILIIVGCTTTKTSLQDIEVNSGMLNIPIRVVENKSGGDVDIHLNVLKNNTPNTSAKASGHSLVNSLGIFEVEKVEGEKYYIEHAGINVNEYEGKNVNWNTPEYSISGDLDIALSNHFVLAGGFNYHKIKDFDYWTHNISIGMFNEKATWAYRFDVGLMFNESAYSVNYVEIEDKDISGDQTRKVYFYNHHTKETYTNAYLSFTLNTRREDFPINFFFNYTIGWQTIFNFEPPINFTSDAGSFDMNRTGHSLSIGIHKNIDNTLRVLGGFRYLTYTNDGGNLNFSNAFLQVDFLLSSIIGEI